MSTKVRKQIYLERRQDQAVKREAKACGVSEAELIRRRIDRNEESGTWGGDDPAAFDSIIRYARRRLANSKRKRQAGTGPPRFRFKEAVGRKGCAQTRQRRSDGKRGWSRDDLYEERVARYGKRHAR